MPSFRRLRAAIHGLAVAAAVLAAGGPALAAPEARASRFADGLLWRVTPAHARVAPSYLYGTIHLGRKHVGELPPGVTAALGASRRVCGELAFDLNTMLGAALGIFRSDGGSLEEDLGSELYRRVEAVLVGNGLPPPFVQMLKPAMAYVLLEAPAGDDAMDALDLRLLSQARADGKEVCGLETAAEQLAALDGIALADVKLLFEVALRQAGRGSEDALAAVLAAWKAERLARLEELMTETAGASPAERRAAERATARLLDDRNVRMLARMRPLVDEGGTFVAVGALHLVGATGLLEGLARAGYHVTRVPLDGLAGAEDRS